MVFSLRHQFLATHLTLVLLFLKAPTTIQAQQEDPVANLSDAEMQIVFEVEEELFQEFFGAGEGDSPIQGGGEPVHYNSSNAPKAPEDWTKMLPPGYKHIDHPGSGHHTRLRPGGAVHLNSRTGAGYTFYFPPDGSGNEDGDGGGGSADIHNHAPGTIWHTMRYPPNYRHNDAPGNSMHTRLYPPEDRHNNAPGNSSHTGRYPPDYRHNNAPGNSSHTGMFPPSYRHNDAPGTSWHTGMYPPDYTHNDAPGTISHTEMYPPDYRHLNAPWHQSHTSRVPSPPPVPTREPTG